MPLPRTINEVLQRLDSIIEETILENNYLGIFAYVYRRTTAAIQQAIHEKQFEDNERMEQFDVVFANRYIEAYENYNLQKPISKSWQVAFNSKDEPMTSIQHLIIGMNAHISFDLGLAAETISPNEQINELKNDFMKVNDILHKIINEMQTRIGKVSWSMFLLDWVGQDSDEKVINFGIVSSRRFAWQFAIGLAGLNGNAKNTLIEKTDEIVAAISTRIKYPTTRTLKFTLKMISFFEKKEVKDIIKNLSTSEKSYL